MRARSESSHVRKIEVLSYKKSTLAWRGFPHRDVTRATQHFLGDGLGVMAPRG